MRLKSAPASEPLHIFVKQLSWYKRCPCWYERFPVQPRDIQVTLVGSTDPRKALRGGISKVNFQETLSILGDKCPRNGSKNDPMAPRTTLECPHEGPSVSIGFSKRVRLHEKLPHLDFYAPSKFEYTLLSPRSGDAPLSGMSSSTSVSVTCWNAPPPGAGGRHGAMRRAVSAMARDATPHETGCSCMS